jgi:hypothetical protein
MSSISDECLGPQWIALRGQVWRERGAFDRLQQFGAYHCVAFDIEVEETGQHALARGNVLLSTAAGIGKA